MHRPAQNIAEEDAAAERGHQIDDGMVEAAASHRGRGRRGDSRKWALALASAVLLGIFVGGRADPVSGFADSLAKPLKDGLPKDYPSLETGPVKFFANFFRVGQPAFTDCRGAPGGDGGCGYVSWVTAWPWMSIAIFVVGSMSCCGFAAARIKYKTLGRWFCVGDYCGGKQPTMTYSSFAYALNATAIVVIVGGLAGLGAVGCLATLRFGTETAEAVVLFNVSLRRPPVDAKETKTHIMSFKGRLERTVAAANLHLKGVPNFTSALLEARARLDAVRGEVRGIRMFVEGCSNLSASPGTACNATFLEQNWRPCNENGSTTVRGLGGGALMSNGNAVPVCRDASGNNSIPCPCCTKCAVIEAQINASLASLANTTSGLFVPIDAAQAGPLLEALWQVIRPSFDLLVMGVGMVNAATVGVMRGLVDSKTLVDAIAVIAWVPAWSTALILMAATCMSFNRFPGGGNAWWAAYCSAGFYFLFVLLPLFAFVSLVSIPLSDFCTSLTAKSPQNVPLLVGIYALGGVPNSTNPNPLLSSLISRCTTQPGGSHWDVVNFTNSSIFPHFSLIDPQALIPPPVRIRTLSTEAHIASWNSSLAVNISSGDAVFNSSSSNCAGSSGWNCTHEYLVYRSDLSAKLASLTQRTVQAQQALSLLHAQSLSMRRNLSQMDAVLRDELLKVWAGMLENEDGSCRQQYTDFERAHRALCRGDVGGSGAGKVGLSTSLDTIWGCSLLLWLLCLPLFPVACQGAKHAQQLITGPLRPNRPRTAHREDVHRIIIDIDRPAPLAEDGNDFKEGGFAYRLREDLVLGVLKCPWEWVMVDKVVSRRMGDGIRVHCSLWVPQPNPNGEDGPSLMRELSRQLKDNDSDAFRQPILRDFFSIKSHDDQADTPSSANSAASSFRDIDALVFEHIPSSKEGNAAEEGDKKGAVARVFDAGKASKIAAQHQKWTEENIATLRQGGRSDRPPASVPVPLLPTSRGGEGSGSADGSRGLFDEDGGGLRFFDPEDNGLFNPAQAVTEIVGSLQAVSSQALPFGKRDKQVRSGKDTGGEFLAV